MKLSRLLMLGGRLIEPIEFGIARPKSEGFMWSGRATVEKDGVIYRFSLWFHGGNDLSEEQAMREMRLELIGDKEKLNSANWHVLPFHDSIWFHPNGWFPRDQEKKLLYGKIKSKKESGEYDYEMGLSPEQREELLDLGFEELVRDPFAKDLSQFADSHSLTEDFISGDYEPGAEQDLFGDKITDCDYGTGYTDPRSSRRRAKKRKNGGFEKPPSLGTFKGE